MEWTHGPADTWDDMKSWLSALSDTLAQQPGAIVVISAHWEEAAFTVSSGAHPSLIYDYYGFPDHTYELTYPAPGAPELAAQVARLLSNAGLPTDTNDNRGYDHGVFIPFKVIFPTAQIPIVQVSLHQSLDPALHLQAGRALAPLRQHNILIVGSGMSYHNMAGFGDPGCRASSEEFDQWLTEAVTKTSGRDEALINWHQAPAARTIHPREEHLIPLMVAAGAAGDDPCEKVFSGIAMDVALSAFRFTSA
ncbi:MAG TPA: dioxygenase [Rhodospirillales bacterium]|nr:dioxygenase [Rhodospirillales bacterium]